MTRQKLVKVKSPWLLVVLLKFGDDNPVTLLDHLIEEELKTVLAHLARNGLELAEPSIRHFGNRRIEPPLTLLLLTSLLLASLVVDFFNDEVGPISSIQLLWQ